MYRKYPHFVDALKRRAEIYNEERAELFQLEKRGTFFSSSPITPRAFPERRRIWKRSRAMWQSGVDQVHARQAQLRDYLDS